MIGTIASNNDVYAFFEGDDIRKIAQGKIEGAFINPEDPSKIGLLEVMVDDAFCIRFGELASFERQKIEGKTIGLKVFISKKKYEELRERDVGVHLGYAHVNLISTERDMSFHDRCNYEQLKNAIDTKNKP